MKNNFLIKNSIVLLFLIVSLGVMAQNDFSANGQVIDQKTGEPIIGATLFIPSLKKGTTSDENGNFNLEKLTPGSYTIYLKSIGYRDVSYTIEIIDQSIAIDFFMLASVTDLTTINITDDREQGSGIQRLRQVENNAIYASKKNELILLSNLTINEATNNSRQIYAKVSGLNIWESDGAGIQLGIGGRGLSPSRNANFNTRQNGYDISADALGYPESYYTPPVQAIERIEVVRGAASLQYGTQFGGMLNFKFKEGPKDKKLAVETIQTVGSFGLFSSFNSVGGTVGKVNYYGLYQYKRSDGWRPNSGLEQHTAYLSANIQVSKKFSIRPEYTHTNYLAQQSGGLTDAQFADNPRQSNRTRNWFAVDWNLFAVKFQIKATEKVRINSQFFGLVGSRDAIGNLGNITQVDFLENRDFLTDEFDNWGNETRFFWQYNTFEQPSTLLVGGRYYEGLTFREQGEGDATDQPDFYFLNPANLEGSSFDLPSKNVSFFAENVFNFSEKWSVTPGLRYEWIRTAAEGYYTQITKDLAGNIISQERFEEDKNNARQFIFFGIGSSYKLNEQTEFYTNFSQNYRALNFNDIRVNVGSLVVDENLKDEKGFNLDLGARGKTGKYFDYDLSVFYLSYRDRIGAILKSVPNPVFNGQTNKIIRFRTNVADADIFGFESLLEWQMYDFFRPDSKDFDANIFTNLSFTSATYKNSQEPGIEGNDVELVPPFIFKTGISIRWKKLKVAYQYSYTAEHFSDATNAIFSPIAIEGLIPAYAVMDLSFSYEWKVFRLETGVNNLSDQAYFTRRATGYPGPGILPSNGRSFYLGVGVGF